MRTDESGSAGIGFDDDRATFPMQRDMGVLRGFGRKVVMRVTHSDLIAEVAYDGRESDASVPNLMLLPHRKQAAYGYQPSG